MESLIEKGTESVITHGPWQALSVGMVVCAIVFLAIMLRNLFLKNGHRNGANHHIQKDIESMRQSMGKLFDGQQKIWHSINSIQVSLAVLETKMGLERSGKNE